MFSVTSVWWLSLINHKQRTKSIVFAVKASNNNNITTISSGTTPSTALDGCDEAKNPEFCLRLVTSTAGPRVMRGSEQQADVG